MPIVYTALGVFRACCASRRPAPTLQMNAAEPHAPGAQAQATGAAVLVCFVLAADRWDSYASMSCVAAATVRRQHPGSRIVLVCDDRTMHQLAGDRTRLTPFFSEIISLPVPVESAKERSRFLKTSLRRIIRGDFLYLDTDTLTVRSLAPVFDVRSAVGLTIEKNGSVDDTPVFPKVFALYDRLGWQCRPKTYYNGGVVFARDDARAAALFDGWHERWMITCAAGCTDDQPALNMTVCELGIDVAVLAPEWNAMVLFFPWRWRECTVGHFFASNPFSSTILGHLVTCFESTGTIDWAAFDRCVDDGHPWGPDPEPWQLWRSRHYAQAISGKVRQLLPR
jgi:hypothetical protein